MFDPVIQDPVCINQNNIGTLVPVKFFIKNDFLLGTVFLADGAGPHPLVLLLHGFPGNETNFDIAHSLRRAGYNVFIFHYRGCWGSSGLFSFSNCIEDVNEAINFILNPETAEKFNIDTTNITVIGYSMGAFAGMINGFSDKKINNIVSIAGFNFGGFLKILPGIPDGEKLLLDGITKGTYFINSEPTEQLYSELFTNIEMWDLLNYSGKAVDKNILLIGAEYDNIAPISLHYLPMVTKFSKVSSKIQSFKLECGHSFVSKRIELTKTIINWLKGI